MADEKAVKIVKVRSIDGGVSQIECHDSLPSTSALAKKYANSAYPDRYIVFSRAQTETGALGEKLSDSQVAHGLFLSILLRPSMFPSQAGLLRALSGVAMISALEEYTDKKLSIGWVSDIFCDGKKIGGVTLEGKLDSFNSYEYIIVSFHLRFSGKNFPPRLSDMVERVFESDNTSTELLVAKNIISKFLPLYFNLKNSTKFMEEYRLKLGMKGQRAKLVRNGKKTKCKIEGVNIVTGSLIVDEKSVGRIEVSTPTGIILPKKIKQFKSNTEGL